MKVNITYNDMFNEHIFHNAFEIATTLNDCDYNVIDENNKIIPHWNNNKKVLIQKSTNFNFCGKPTFYE